MMTYKLVSLLAFSQERPLLLLLMLNKSLDVYIETVAAWTLC